MQASVGNIGVDYDSAKVVLPVLGGLLAFAGGVFAFVNGRLNEAGTPERRALVTTYILFSFIIVFSLGGVIAHILGEHLIGYTLLSLMFIVNNVEFLRNKGPVRRHELVMFFILYCVVAIYISSIFTIYLVTGKWL